MAEGPIKHRVGKTPLVRAVNLEKELGIKKIYLKLEGNNPSGHREDRLADLLIRDALAVNKDTICLGTLDKLGVSIAYLAGYYDLKIVFVLPWGSKATKDKIFSDPHVDLITVDQPTNACVGHSAELAQEKGWYNANPGQENNVLNMTALSYISGELVEQVRDNIDSVFMLMSYGFSMTGIHLGFRQLWVEDKVARIPLLYSCTTDRGNVIYESYRRQCHKIVDMPRERIKISKYNKHLINTDSAIAQAALDAVYDTGGKITAISDEELIDYVKRFKTLEKIKMHTSAGYAVAGFMKEVKAKSLGDGTHVILLNDGRVNLEIRQVKREENVITIDQVAALIDEWLMEYTDHQSDIHEALNNAFDQGMVLLAYHTNELVGIGVVVSLGFEKFATKYHLAYIATKKNIKGRGIATVILQKAIELTGGNLSLHVDLDNKRAIKLYRKMGFRNDYYRMIYHAD